MKQLWIVLLCLGVAVPQAAAQKKPTLKTQKEKVSYIIGTDIGKNMTKQGIDIDPEALLRGIKDAISGEGLLLTEEQMTQIRTEFQQEMMKKQNEKAAELAIKNKAQGEEFLAANKKKDSVVTLPSGLQYKVLVEGKGKMPTISDTVTTNYRGMLIDGTEFDNSYQRGQPATFPCKGVIAGWTEALQLMKVGSKWQLFIPSNLAYGERGAGQTIPPNSVLIFDVELLSVK